MRFYEEKERPSTALIILTIIPLIILVAVILLTDSFNAHPHMPPFYYAILTLILLGLSLVTSFFAFFLARDEEPEWGSKLPFKVIQGLAISFAVLSAVFIVLIIFIYYL